LNSNPPSRKPTSRLIVKDGKPEPDDPAHLPAVLEGLAQARRREFASDAEVEAAFRRFDR
jgi:hypothetical protein